MNDLIVIMMASAEVGMMPLYREQLRAADIAHHVEWTPSFPNINGGGTLAHRLDSHRRLAEQFSHYEFIIFSDAFDVQFFGSKREVKEKIYSNLILCAAERNCYPEPHLADSINGPYPWKFFNGGLCAGRPKEFIRWIDELKAHPGYDPNMLDQTFFNRLLAEGSPLVEIDFDTQLFYCLYREHEGWELDFKGGMPYNSVTHNWPNFLHCNGGSDRAEVWAKRERSLIA